MQDSSDDMLFVGKARPLRVFQDEKGFYVLKGKKKNYIKVTVKGRKPRNRAEAQKALLTMKRKGISKFYLSNRVKLKRKGRPYRKAGTPRYDFKNNQWKEVRRTADILREKAELELENAKVQQAANKASNALVPYVEPIKPNVKKEEKKADDEDPDAKAVERDEIAQLRSALFGKTDEMEDAIASLESPPMEEKKKDKRKKKPNRRDKPKIREPADGYDSPIGRPAAGSDSDPTTSPAPAPRTIDFDGEDEKPYEPLYAGQFITPMRAIRKDDIDNEDEDDYLVSGGRLFKRVKDNDDSTAYNAKHNVKNDESNPNSHLPALWNDQIDKFFKDQPLYTGTIALDEIKYIPKQIPQGFVINTQPSNKDGEHWQAVYISPDSVEFYDSYGDKPDKRIIKDIKAKLEEWKVPTLMKWKVNNVAGQSPDSDTCGYFAMRFLDERFHGVPFDQVTRFITPPIGSGQAGGRKIVHVEGKGEETIKNEFSLI